MKTNKKESKAGFGAIALLLILMSIVSTIWTLVSFIVYLVKDIPFNWWSLGMFCTTVVIIFAGFLYLAVKVNTYVPKDAAKKVVKSKFQQRLEEAANRQKENL